MAIVFVSPKQRQKMFFLGITVLFLLLLFIIGVIVFFSKPKQTSEEQIFIKPEIKIDFNVLDLEQVRGSLIMGRVQIEFAYLATTDQGEKESGSVFASSAEEAKRILEDSGLISVEVTEILRGRDNPFSPYY